MGAHEPVTQLEIDQRIFDLYDEYCHGRIDRREFLARSAAVVMGGLVMAQALLPLIEDQERALAALRRALARDLAAHGIERGQNHRARRVVNQHGHPRGVFKRADVASIASDDPAFHVVTCQGDGGGGGLEGVLAGIALDGEANDAARLLLAGKLGGVRLLDNGPLFPGVRFDP